MTMMITEPTAKEKSDERKASYKRAKSEAVEFYGMMTAWRREWYAESQARMAETARAGALRAINRLPAWCDREACAAFYRHAKEITRLTGTRHEVDHILPINGKLVSGLHVAANLQVLTAAENRAKGNRHDL